MRKQVLFSAMLSLGIMGGLTLCRKDSTDLHCWYQKTILESLPLMWLLTKMVRP